MMSCFIEDPGSGSMQCCGRHGDYVIFVEVDLGDGLGYISMFGNLS